MILKGYTKNIVVVKNLENQLIEEAFLILKKEAREEATETDIVREANMLISGCDIRAKKKAPLGGLGSGQLRLTADVKQRPEQPGKQTRAAVNNDLHAVPLLFGK